MKKFNGMESHLIIEALNYYVKQVEEDILEAENMVKDQYLHLVFTLMCQKS